MPRTSRRRQSPLPARRRWLPVAVAVLLLGLLTSALGGIALRASVNRSGRATFHAAAENATDTLTSLLGRDGDFVATLRAVLSMQTRITPTGFQTWYRLLQGSRRQVGGAGTALIAAVPARNVRSFQARRNADPAFRRLMRGRVSVVPRSHSGRYCPLAGGTATADVNATERSVVQSDWCQPGTPMGRYQLPLLRAAALSGDLLTQATRVDGLQAMYFEAAFYRPGANLRTPAQREAAVAGWLVSSFDMPALIRSAIDPGPSLAVSLYHLNPGAGPALVGQYGNARGALPLVAQTRVNIDGEWVVTVRGTPITHGLPGTAQGILVFIGGAAVSVLLFLTLSVLGRSRERALELVAEKTGQLQHQAAHDPIDDFGTGYSSLAYLRQFPVDTLKIDRAFVQGAATSRQSAALLRMLIRLGKSLGLETLGEGIESPEQLALLQLEECDTGQGYMFGRPVDAEALTEFLTGPRTPVAGPV